MPKVWNKRQRGIPPDAVYVGRPSKWGNPFEIGQADPIHPDVIMDRAWVVNRYQSWLTCSLEAKPLFDAIVPELRGKDLVCWCAPKACHADVLLEVANVPGETE